MAAATTAPSALSAHIKKEHAELIQQAQQHEGQSSYLVHAAPVASQQALTPFLYMLCRQFAARLQPQPAHSLRGLLAEH